MRLMSIEASSAPEYQDQIYQLSANRKCIKIIMYKKQD